MQDDRGAARALFFDIARCSVAFGILDDTVGAHPCRRIVEYQDVPSPEFQLPEPWVGHIETAPLLFVASNPSIGNDAHSLRCSTDQKIWESRVELFDDSSGYTRRGIYATYPDGTVEKKHVRHWAFVRNRARELLQRAPRPGIDYALTEIAHCKTRDEIGVAQCAAFCAERYLKKIMNVAPAQLVVAMGFYAHREMRKLFGVPLDQKYAKLSNDRRIIFAPHSNFRGRRTLAAAFPEHLTELREYMKAT
jgi:hypothetical protein